MKLSHLSLAILSAIALAACGGSGSDDHTTDPNANKPGATDQTPKQPEDKKDEDKKEDTAKEDDKIVNPTDEQVVDNINLAETSTTASQQYIRGKKSSFDRTANPSEPASATVLSGISLDVQNPQLTNIVIGRAEGKNNKGEQVRIAQYAGTTSNEMKDGQSLQSMNEPNALVQHFSTINRDIFATLNSNGDEQTNGFIAGSDGAFINPAINDAKSKKDIAGAPVKFSELLTDYATKKALYDVALRNFEAAPTAANKKALEGAIDGLVKVKAATAPATGNVIDTADSSPAINKLAIAEYSADLERLKISPEDLTVKVLNKTKVDIAHPENLKDDSNYDIVKVQVPNKSKLANYGYGRYIFTLDNNTIASGGLFKGGWGDKLENNKIVGVAADSTLTDKYNDQAGPTHGLVGIWEQGGKFRARGTDDNNIRDTRIFGHYYLNPGEDLNGDLFSETNNSWLAPDVIITHVDKNYKADKYGLAAVPATLNHVQYGRVTAEMDKIVLANRSKTSGWRFERQTPVARDPEHKGVADDFYFYRGTDATTIDEMAKLPTDVKIGYQGHALMYGLDNSFHGSGQNLPNAFGTTQSYGLGNFVEAELDMGKKELTGTVYNAWHNDKQANVYKDVLVDFSGNVVGNTAYGEATRRYVDNDTPATFKGSFYGTQAEELGGAINSVTDKEVYGKIGWGGVFGARRTSTGGNAWLVSSEKK